MTGFSDNTVRNVEAGKDTTVSYLVEVCIAVGLHPKDLFDMELEMKPRFELSPERKNKKKLTLRIREYIREGYFDTSRSAKDVVLKLEEDGIRTSSAVLSNILPRWLKTTKKGRRNSYRSK
ncbi:hypothetical protein DN748_17005 [Sinomicrobium soli]|nr:hypothetical protein DN748_17005 [Sinomicrobium sp. N-1-3-6]